MPVIRRRRVVRKRKAPKRMYRKRGVGRATIKRTSDYAKVVEIVEQPLMAVNTSVGGDSVGSAVNFCLADYQRPQEVAHAYKYYRAAKCEITFIPYYNISQTAGGAGTRLPQLYMSVDRLSNRWIVPTESEMLERGITPRLFTKKMRMAFKPNLLQEISLETVQSANLGPPLTPLGITAAGFQNATAVFNKWLPTQQSYGYLSTAGQSAVSGSLPQVGQVLAPNGVNPYALRYHGAVYVPSIEGIGTEAVQVGDIQIKITWEFKGPRALKTLSPVVEQNTYAITSSQGASTVAAPPALPNTQPTSYP